jgi:hypothetical protein
LLLSFIVGLVIAPLGVLLYIVLPFFGEIQRATLIAWAILEGFLSEEEGRRRFGGDEQYWEIGMRLARQEHRRD